MVRLFKSINTRVSSFFSVEDEICRVMKSLAMTLFEHCLPYLFQSIPIRRLYQRKGHMHSQHNPLLCEACHLGFCY
jgi:hypothetical protein